jgi:protein-disulfide isomerase
MRRSNTFIAILFLISASILFMFGLVTLEPLEQNLNDGGGSVELTPLEKPMVDFGNPQIGTSDAPVTIVEYGDYGCAPCAEMSATLARITTDYAERVRIVWKDFPNETMHNGSEQAAEAARCAGAQGQFWEFNSALLSLPGLMDTGSYATIAATMGLDAPSLQTCLETRAMRAAVRRDMEEGLRLRLDATPFLFVNDRRVSGALDYDQLKALIDAELAKLAK